MSNRKKIVLIGPVFPYKGGISHYTGLLYRALVKQHDVYMMSYKLQYPRLLFKKEQRDYSNDTFKIQNADYLINTANPFNWLFCASKIRDMKPDLVIFQWWHPYFAPCYWSICKLLDNFNVLFVCHNVFPHERFPLDHFLAKRVLINGDFFIVHSSQDEADLLSIKKEAVYYKTVIPAFNIFKLQNLTQEAGRNMLGYHGHQKLLLFFGFIRHYKGLKYLLKAMPSIVAQLPDVKLLVVGEFAGDRSSYLQMISELGMDDYIDIYSDYIPDREVEKFFAVSDLVVLPYESATQSGIVQIAYTFEKAVIVTNTGGLPEVVDNGVTGYVVEPKNSMELADKIIEYFTLNKSADFAAAIRTEAEKYSWDRLTEIITKFLQAEEHIEVSIEVKNGTYQRTGGVEL